MSQTISHDGNTKRHRARSWFFTYNNPTISWSQLSQLLKVGDVIKMVGQLERGDSGTEHFQGVVQFKNQITFKTLRSIDQAIHWEKCKNLRAALEYCTKAESRIEGPWAMGWDIPEQIRTIERGNFRPWQRTIENRLQYCQSDRSIYWIWEDEGGVGKTAYAKSIAMRGGLVLGGRGADIKYGVADFIRKHGKLGRAVFHFTRSVENYVSYQAIEEVKDGIFYNSKYESGMVVFNPPQLLCLANFPPEESKLSRDRWVIGKIIDMEIYWLRE